MGARLTRGTNDVLRTSKTVTFTGAANLGEVGAVPIYTVTGEVLVVALIPYCTVNLTEAAPTGATLLLGVTGDTDLFIASTAATAIGAGEFWVSATPTANGIAVPAGLKDIVITDNIIGTVGTANVDGGAIRFDLYYAPLSSDGNVS